MVAGVGADCACVIVSNLIIFSGRFLLSESVVKEFST